MALVTMLLYYAKVSPYNVNVYFSNTDTADMPAGFVKCQTPSRVHGQQGCRLQAVAGRALRIGRGTR